MVGCVLARTAWQPERLYKFGACKHAPYGPINEVFTVIGADCVMPNYIRPKVTGASIFFTVALQERGGQLLTDNIDHLRRSVAATLGERPFRIDAWVVLPDHLHCIWTLPGGDRDYATRWRLIKSRFSMELPKGVMRASHHVRQERGVWQRRFWEHHIRDEGDMAAHIQYCWINPVKHGFVERAEDWPYSSVHRDMRVGA